MATISGRDIGDDDLAKLDALHDACMDYLHITNAPQGRNNRYGTVDRSLSGGLGEKIPQHALDYQQGCVPQPFIAIELDQEVDDKVSGTRKRASISKHVYGRGPSPVLQKQMDRYLLRPGNGKKSQTSSLLATSTDVGSSALMQSRFGRLGRAIKPKPVSLSVQPAKPSTGFDQSPRPRPAASPSLSITPPVHVPRRFSAQLAAASRPPPTTPFRMSTTVVPQQPQSVPAARKSPAQNALRRSYSAGGGAGAVAPPPLLPSQSPAKANLRSHRYVAPPKPLIRATPRGLDSLRYTITANASSSVGFTSLYCTPTKTEWRHDPDLARQLEAMMAREGAGGFAASYNTAAAHGSQHGAKVGQGTSGLRNERPSHPLDDDAGAEEALTCATAAAELLAAAVKTKAAGARQEGLERQQHEPVLEAGFGDEIGDDEESEGGPEHRCHCGCTVM